MSGVAAAPAAPTALLADAVAALAWLAVRVAPGSDRLRTDSRRVQPGDVFIAWPGAATDGRRYVGAALAAGAAACLVEADGVQEFGFADPRVAALPALKAACGPLAAAWFDQPSRALDVIAVTGTNGKSSSAWWTAQALTRLGRRCALVGTLGIGEPPGAAGNGSVVATGLTTPDPVTLQAAFAAMRRDGVRACAVEASSIGLVEQRLAGSAIAVAQFTNFTRDHLDLHPGMAAYWDAKRGLFDWPGLRAAVVNIDDPQGAALAAELAPRAQATALDLWTTARADATARLRALDLRQVDGGLAFALAEAAGGAAGAQQADASSVLFGDYNADNLLTVVGALRALGVPLADAAAALAHLSAVPGRLQRVAAPPGLPAAVVDYAHTPDALDKALAALRPLATARGGRLWCVFGCGGNRDATKRPLMGQVAQARADRVVLTSDNPRDESPLAILAQVRAGLSFVAPVEVIDDRAAAVVHALHVADAADVVLIAGKGHEDYQEVAGRRLPFSDVEVAGAALAARAGGCHG